MKNHIILKVFKDFDRTLAKTVPYWKDLILNKSLAVETFFPAFDQLFASHHFKFWVTHEYEPDSTSWSAEEEFAELQLIYRIIFQEDYTLPGDFLRMITFLPGVQSAKLLEVVETPLPKLKLSTAASVSSMMDVGGLIYLPYAKNITRGDADIKIAVLDTGVNLNHRELTGKFKCQGDFVNMTGLDTTDFIGDVTDYDDVPEDEVGHGTHVSGIIAARGIQMNEGICPNCTIVPVRVLATMKSGSKLVGAGIVDNINTGIKWAVDNGADVINMSLGIKNTGGGLPHEDVIKYAVSKKVTIVAASGNDGTEEKYYPGALPDVIAVGATDASGNVTGFTSYGADITVVAPGLNIYSSFTNNTYAFASGTSQASPFVCGSIGLLKSYAKQRGKDLANDAIKYILKHSSDKADNRMRNLKAGYGLINLADAFKLLHYIIH